MDNSVGSTIEKIKLNEHIKENKLKEKRKHEAELAALHKAIKDATLQAEKSDQEKLEIMKRIEKLQPLLELGKIKRTALLAQLETFTKELEDLKAQSNQGIDKVWSLRSSLCETVHGVSDECDIRGLLMRPVYTEPELKPRPQSVNNNLEILEYETQLLESEDRLKVALQRRKNSVAERDKLLAEPNVGEEFVRIKDALRYCLEKTANLQN